MSEIKKSNEKGWAYLINSPKWHYFKNGKSLCGKWAAPFLREFELGNNDSPDNCKACKLKALEEK